MATPGALTVAPKLKKITNKIARAVTDAFTVKAAEKVVTGRENIPDGPVIFASSHQGILDNFAWIPETPYHAVIMHGEDTRILLVLAQLNTGLILVARYKKDWKKRILAKLDMMTALLKGHSVYICPEAAWNLSPNKLHLPVNHGFLDVARKVQVPVVPMTVDYTYDTSTEKEKITKINIHYGKPICIGREDSLQNKLDEYTEEIATWRWKFIEEKGVFQRKEISNYEYINFLKGNIRNLELGKKRVEVERESIQGAAEEFYRFHHLNDHRFDENGNLLETEEVERLKRINLEHGI